MIFAVFEMSLIACRR